MQVWWPRCPQLEGGIFLTHKLWLNVPCGGDIDCLWCKKCDNTKDTLEQPIDPTRKDQDNEEEALHLLRVEGNNISK